MIKSILYKEGVKTSRLLLLLLIVAVALVVYTFLNNAYNFRNDGAVAQFSAIADRNISFIPNFVVWFFVVIPIAISAVQYVNEIVDKRLKLTLHLPHCETSILAAMQLFGLCSTLVIYSLIIAPLYCGMLIYYPIELVNASVSALLPYVMAGLASYFFAMWVVVEPVWRRRVVSLLVWIGTMSIFMIDSAKLTSYSSAILTLTLLLIGSWVCSLYSSARFKDGAQS